MTVGQPQSNTQSPGTTIPDQNLGGTDVKDEMPMSREKKTVEEFSKFIYTNIITAGIV